MSATTAGAVFDALAERYDSLWSESAIGRQQRTAVWRWIDPLFCSGDRLLDLGCGTGVDAAHFMERGIQVVGIDASAQMVRVARTRGVDAHQLAVEALDTLHGNFEGALSNFGALNCVANLQPVALSLARLIRIRGHLAISLAGSCCAWEIFHYLSRLQPAKAFRRWKPAGSCAYHGVPVYYPSVRHIVRLFQPNFRLTQWCGIGLGVPPSYIESISETSIARLAAMDRRLAHLPLLRALADHRLLVFERI
jgi:SAM-dependent methyltransferase